MSILAQYIRPFCNQGNDGLAPFIALMHLKATLLAVQSGEYPLNKRHGICSLTGHIPTQYHPYVDNWIVINLIRRPEYSGYPVFPISAPNNGDAVAAFYDAEDLWDKSTEYGRNRWAALDYLSSLLIVMDATTDEENQDGENSSGSG